jgi:hypothetical protein
MGAVLREAIPVDFGMSRKFEGWGGLVLTLREETRNRFVHWNVLDVEWIDIEMERYFLPGRVLNVGTEPAWKP